MRTIWKIPLGTPNHWALLISNDVILVKCKNECMVNKGTSFLFPLRSCDNSFENCFFFLQILSNARAYLRIIYEKRPS